MVQQITYRQLRPLMVDRIGQHGLPTGASLANVQSALSGFLEERGLNDSSVVGVTLRSGFNEACESHIAALRTLDRSSQFCRNRRHYLRPWALLINILDHECACIAGVTTPLQDALRAAMRGRKVSSTARGIGLPSATFRGWLAGGVPRPGKTHFLRRLEVLCELRPAALTGLLPFREAVTEESECPSIAWREENGQRCADEYCLSAEQAPSILREEYSGLLAYKSAFPTAPGTGKALFRDVIAVRDAAVGKTWRLTAPPPETSLKGRWFDVVGGQVCVSGRITWRGFASFFGWATLSPERHGAGLSVESLTLALLLDVALVERYLDWHTRRVGGINRGHVTFLSKISMLCHPHTGFLLTQPDIGARGGFADPSAWHRHCGAANDALRAIVRKIKPHVVATRKPEEPLKAALELAESLAPFVKAVRRLVSNRGFRSGVDEAIWSRDLLLMALLMSNPLRRKNLAQLTYRSDNSGHLRRTAAGGWRIFIPRGLFKNAEKGAAKDHEYAQPMMHRSGRILSNTSASAIA